MATNRSIDYIAKDFDSVVDALITYATVNFGPDTAANRQWTDFNVDDFSRTWLELVAYVADQIFYYLDVQATQSNLQTATIRSTILNLAKQFGYVVPTATSASGLAKFVLLTNQVIPVGFKLAATNGSPFFVASTTPAVGSTTLSPILQVIQGEQKQDTFTAMGVQGEEIALNFGPLVRDEDNAIAAVRSPQVTVNSNPFILIDTFINSLPTDKHYRVFTNTDGKAVLKFGDGIFGQKLNPSDSIIVNYRIGGGAVGNISADTLTVLVDSATFIQSVTNPLTFSGGADEPTTDKLRELIPASLRTLERAVSVDDYADITLANFSNVDKAAAEENTEDPGIDVNLYIVPSGNTITAITQNAPLQNSIGSFIDKRKTVTTVVSIRDAYGVDIKFKIRAYLVSGVSRSAITETITSTLQNFLDLQSGDIDGSGTKFGQQILLNSLYQLLDTIEGIDRFEIEEFNYVPRTITDYAIGAKYLLGEVELFPSAEASEWLVVPEECASSPSYIPYRVYKKLTGVVSNLSADGLSDDTLNFSSVESITSAIDTTGGANIIFDSTKTFLPDEFVGGLSSITLSNKTGHTFDFTGSTFVPRKGDRIQQGNNFAFIKQILDPNTFVLSTGLPSDITNGAATIVRDEFLFVDAANNIWTISDNDSHSVQLSTFAINNTVISAVTAGDYKIVKSYIGATIIFRNLIFDGIDYNTHNTVTRVSSSFNLVGTIGDEFQISRMQEKKGNFGVPTTIDSFSSSTPTVGKGRVHFADDPDLSAVTTGITSSYVLIDSAQNIFEIIAVDNSAKTVDIRHQAGVTVNPVVSSGSSASVCERYYSDNNEVSFVNGISNLTTGIGFAAIGSITTIIAANIVDGEVFVLKDGVNPPVTFEFDKGGGVAVGNEAVDITLAVTADDVRDAIISAVGGASLLAISATSGGSALVLLQNNSLGTAGNQAIIEGVADIGFITRGMSGGLNAGSLPTPRIPGTGSYANELGIDTNGNIVDRFKFRISGYADDITNLRKDEIPQFNSSKLILDLRGGIS
jgi:hypothetical protein